jgi:hypothetical protein
MATQQKASQQNATLLRSNDKLHFLSITLEVTFAKIKKQTMLKKLYPKIKKNKKIISYKRVFVLDGRGLYFQFFLFCLKL